MKTRKLLTATSKACIALMLVATSLLVATAQPAAAQESQDKKEQITLSPASQSYELTAGSSVQDSMKIINDGEAGYDFIVYARPYSVSNELYEPDFKDQKANADAYTWIQFEKTSFHVDPGKTVVVNYTMHVPANATPGGHYGVVFAETKEQALGTTGVARKKRVGKLIYATVKGDYKTAGEFKNFVLPFWQNHGPFVSSARVANTGNVDFDAKASTVVKDVFGNTKFTYTGDAIVLPGTTRLIEMKWDKAPSFGFFKVDQGVTFLGQNHEQSGYVLIAPRWLPVLLIVVLLGGAAYAASKKYLRRR